MLRKRNFMLRLSRMRAHCTFVIVSNSWTRTSGKVNLFVQNCLTNLCGIETSLKETYPQCSSHRARGFERSAHCCSITSVRQGGRLPLRSTNLVWAHQPLLSMTNKQRLALPKLLVYLLMYLVNKRLGTSLRCF